jgi:hypothetical protein
LKCEVDAHANTLVMPGLDPRLSGSIFAVQGARH